MAGTKFAMSTVALDLKMALVLEFREIQVHERVRQANSIIFLLWSHSIIKRVSSTYQLHAMAAEIVIANAVEANIQAYDNMQIVRLTDGSGTLFLVLEILECLDCWLVEEIEALFWFSTAMATSAFISKSSTYHVVNGLLVTHLYSFIEGTEITCISGAFKNAPLYCISRIGYSGGTPFDLTPNV